MATKKNEKKASAKKAVKKTVTKKASGRQTAKAARAKTPFVSKKAARMAFR